MHKFRENLISLMKSGTGIAVDFFDMLYMDQLENGNWRVCSQPDASKELYEGIEIIYHTAEEAVDCFLTIRKQNKFGYDYEGV